MTEWSKVPPRPDPNLSGARLLKDGVEVRSAILTNASLSVSHPTTRNPTRRMTSPRLNLTAAPGSFPFTTKSISLPAGHKVMLGSIDGPVGASPRIPSPSNGWFPPRQVEDGASGISPLPLGSCHAEVWSEGGKILIKDLESAFGTFVNGMRISSEVTLKTGDVLSLGGRIPRNTNTPAYITDFHLSPIIANISL